MSTLADRFGFFDPSQPYTVTHGQLPHWEQEGATYFITFRTADSVPFKVLESWRKERDDWLRKHGVEIETSAWHVGFEKLPWLKQQEFNRHFAGRFEHLLDNCHGECVLKRPEIASIVADSLRHFDATEARHGVSSLQEPCSFDAPRRSNPPAARYYLGDFVIMPNHVHLLVCFLKSIGLRSQCYSWKKFTAGAINKVLGKVGEFWQKESFDHLVRDADHFERFRKYIAENPSKAGLKEGEYYYYRCDENASPRSVKTTVL